jgi:hypothetical protein
VPPSLPCRSGLLAAAGALLLATALMPGSAAAAPPTARPACVVRTVGLTTYDFSVCGVPDIDQVRATANGHTGLPNNGKMYCVVAANMNWLAFLAEQGFTISPTDKDWTLDANFDEMSNDLAQLGQLMSTNAQKGTSGSGQITGVTAWLDSNATGVFSKDYMVVKSYEAGSFYSPNAVTMAQDAIAGGLVTPVVGYYANKTNASGLTRLARVGGHEVSLVSASGALAQSSAQLGVRNPATDSGVDTVQTAYATDSWALATATTARYFSLDASGNPSGQYKAKLSSVNGSPTTLYDGYGTIEPKSTVSSVGSKIYIKRAIDVYAPPSPDPGPLIALKAQGPVEDLAYPLEGTKTPYLVKGRNTVYQADALSGRSSRLARGPAGAHLLAFGGADQKLFVGGSRKIQAFDHDGRRAGSVRVGAKLDDLTFDSKANRLVGISNTTNKLVLFSPTLKHEGALKLPASLTNGGGKLTAAVGPEGQVFFHQNGTGKVGQVAEAHISGKGVPGLSKTVAVGRRNLATKQSRGLAVDDQGHIFTVQNGKQVELLPTGKRAPNSRFTGAPGSAHIDVDRSFTNHDPKHGPETLDFLPDDQLQPPPGPGPGPAGPQPDLVISAAQPESITVRNQGPGAAGAFIVRAVDPVTGAQEDVHFSGLAAGASATQPIGCVAHDRGATVDALGQVAESNEQNNGGTVPACKP